MDEIKANIDAEKLAVKERVMKLREETEWKINKLKKKAPYVEILNYAQV